MDLIWEQVVVDADDPVATTLRSSYGMAGRCARIAA
jgi:hypothetical protein